MRGPPGCPRRDQGRQDPPGCRHEAVPAAALAYPRQRTAGEGFPEQPHSRCHKGRFKPSQRSASPVRASATRPSQPSSIGRQHHTKSRRSPPHAAASNRPIDRIAAYTRGRMPDTACFSNSTLNQRAKRQRRHHEGTRQPNPEFIGRPWRSEHRPPVRDDEGGGADVRIQRRTNSMLLHACRSSGASEAIFKRR